MPLYACDTPSASNASPLGSHRGPSPAAQQQQYGCISMRFNFQPPTQESKEAEKAAARRINKVALDNVVYAPRGQYLQHQAWYKNIIGVP
jgi:hypothetical protein